MITCWTCDHTQNIVQCSSPGRNWSTEPSTRTCVCTCHTVQTQTWPCECRRVSVCRASPNNKPILQSARATQQHIKPHQLQKKETMSNRTLEDKQKDTRQATAHNALRNIHPRSSRREREPTRKGEPIYQDRGVQATASLGLWQKPLCR